MGSTSPFRARRSSWSELSPRFTGDRECLASFLALEAAEVLQEVKPANLIGIVNRRRACGRNPYRLWKALGNGLLAESGLSARELADRRDSLLLLIYRPSSVTSLLRKPDARAVLRKAGYGDHTKPEPFLDELAARIGSGQFPHEVGVLLGYPLKDVAAFMGLVSLPFTCQGPWKIYGDPRKSLCLAETFRTCRALMAEQLTRCATPFDCLRGEENTAGAFLRPAIENDSHNYRLSRNTARAPETSSRHLKGGTKEC
jgi:uncharacterized protein DUF3793